MFSRNKKHEQVRALILQRHLGLAIGSPIPPEIQLAREFDVSRVTVARAINDLVRQGILWRHQGKGTFVADRRLHKRTQCLGVLRCHNRSPISDPFHSGILAGIEEVALDADYAVTIFGVRNRAREVLPPEEAAVKPVDGLIVLGIMSPEYLAQLSQNRIPSVGVEYHFEAEAPIDYVIQDCEASAFEVTRLLIERGHNRIAYFGHACRNINPVSSPDQNSLERMAGLRRAFQSAGAPCPEDLIFQAPHPHWSSNAALFKHIFNRDHPPTAVFCERQGLLSELLAYLRAEGRADCTPFQFVTVGRDALYGERVSTWRILEDWLEMGRIAARRALLRIQDPELAPRTFKVAWQILPPEE